jgi:hypothetical protein
VTASYSWPPKRYFLITRGQRRSQDGFSPSCFSDKIARGKRREIEKESLQREGKDLNSPYSDCEGENNRSPKGRCPSLKGQQGVSGSGFNSYCILQLSDWASKTQWGPGSIPRDKKEERHHSSVGWAAACKSLSPGTGFDDAMTQHRGWW